MPARQFATAAIASLLIACAFAATSSVAFAAQRAAKTKAKPEAQASLANCQDEAGLTMLASPMAPWKGAPLRVVFAAEKPLDGELSLIAPNGNIAAASGVPTVTVFGSQDPRVWSPVTDRGRVLALGLPWPSPESCGVGWSVTVGTSPSEWRMSVPIVHQLAGNQNRPSARCITWADGRGRHDELCF